MFIFTSAGFKLSCGKGVQFLYFGTMHCANFCCVCMHEELSLQIRNPAYLVPVPSQDKLGGLWLKSIVALGG